MTLQEQIVRDAAAVFLNASEFAERITIDGIEDIPALCDWSVAPGGENPWGSTDGPWGVNTVHAVISIEAGIFPCPEPGQVLVVNGRRWTVQHAEADQGILDIKLMRNVA